MLFRWPQLEVFLNDRVWLSISWRSCYCSRVTWSTTAFIARSDVFNDGASFSLIVISWQVTLMLFSFVLSDIVSFDEIEGCLCSSKFCWAYHLGLPSLYLVLGSRYWFSLCICLVAIGLLLTIYVSVYCLLHHGEQAQWLQLENISFFFKGTARYSVQIVRTIVYYHISEGLW